MKLLLYFVCVSAFLLNATTAAVASESWEQDLIAGETAWKNGEYEKAERHFRSVEEEAIRQDYGPLVSYSRHLATYVAEEKTGEYESSSRLDFTFPHLVIDNGFYAGARTALERAVERQEQNAPPSLLMPLLALGRTYQHEGDLQTAEMQFERAIAIFEELDYTTQVFNGWIVLLLSGDFYRDTERFTKAEDYYQRALPLVAEVNTTKGTAYGYVLMRLAENDFYQERYDEAEAHLLQATSIFMTNSATTAHAHSLQWQAEIARVRGLQDKADDLDKQAAKLLSPAE